MKIQLKITLLFVALTGTVIFILSGSIFYFASRFSFEDFYKRLEARVRITSQAYLTDPKLEQNRLTVYNRIPHDYLETLENERAFIVNTAIKGGNISDTLLPAKFIRLVEASGQARYNKANVFYAGKRVETNGRRFIVAVSAKDPYGLEELANLRKILIIGFVLALLLIFIIGQIFSHQTLKPIRQMIGRVKNITAKDLHQRLPGTNGKDELNELARTFNDMLARIDTAFQTQNNFISNASHELRTPITIIRGEIELQQNNRNIADPQGLQSVLVEVSKLEHILSSLLTLAQSGFDGKKQHWEIIRMDELLMSVKKNVEQMRPGCIIQFDMENMPENEEQLCVEGNDNLLILAVSNVVSNACKYSGDNPVLISLQAQERQLIIVVTDWGIGIPEKEVKRVFDPFFRASNTDKFNGHGVGLPLSLNIISLHQGSIRVKSIEEKSTEISISLPYKQV